MNTTEMLAQLRLNALLEDTATDYPDAVLLREMSDGMVSKFQSTVVGMRSGYWQQHYFQVITDSIARYRIAPQASVISKVEIGYGDSSNNFDDVEFTRLPLVQEGHSDLFERNYSGVGQPRCYAVRGTDIVILPTPDNSGYVMKVTYMRRPPRLYPSQNALSGTDRGRVTAVNTSARTISVNAVPFNNAIATPAEITTANTSTIDVVRPNGWFDHPLSNQPYTISGTTITVGGSYPLRDVQVGDYVRAFNQSDWPMLPEDFHRAVVDIATVKVLVQRGYTDKAVNFAGDVSADLQRFDTLYSKRVVEEPRLLRAPLTAMRRWSMRR